MRVSQKFLTLCLSILICHLFMPMQNVRGQTATKNQPQLIVQLGHGHLLSSVAFSPDGRFVLTGSEDGTAILWEILRGREVRRFEGHMDNVRSVAFSPDGRFVLTGSNDKTARLWDRATGREVRRVEGHIGDVSSVAFSPDGRFVLTGSNDQTARLWDTATGREVKRFDGIVSPVALSPDGHFVLAVSGAGDRSVRLLETSSGREVSRFEGGSGWIISIALPGRALRADGWRLHCTPVGGGNRQGDTPFRGPYQRAYQLGRERWPFPQTADSCLQGAMIPPPGSGRRPQDARYSNTKREGLWGFSSIAFFPMGGSY